MKHIEIMNIRGKAMKGLLALVAVLFLGQLQA